MSSFRSSTPDADDHSDGTLGNVVDRQDSPLKHNFYLCDAIKFVFRT